jgi:hypothetical protein
MTAIHLIVHLIARFAPAILAVAPTAVSVLVVELALRAQPAMPKNSAAAEEFVRTRTSTGASSAGGSR